MYGKKKAGPSTSATILTVASWSTRPRTQVFSITSSSSMKRTGVNCGAASRPGVLVFSCLIPLDQLLFLAPLAHTNGLLLHASGAVIDGKAFVFAGHSGDGKTTLSRLLAAEGLELLSDERIALRREGESFRAYGTPWPGEG